RDGRDERREFLRLCAERAAAGVRNAIKLRVPSQLGRSPLSLDPAVALHAVERGIERAFLDLQCVTRVLAEPADNGVAVAGTEGERFENERVECAVKAVFGGWHDGCAVVA